MKNPVKEHGRKVSFLYAEQDKTSYLDLMKKKIDSEAGREIYSHRMYTTELVFQHFYRHTHRNKLSFRKANNTEVNRYEEKH
jgi:uncharacterized DUF497 family protein